MLRKIFTGHHLYNLVVEELSKDYEKQGIFEGKRLEPLVKNMEDIESYILDNLVIRNNEAINLESLKFKKNFLANEINKRGNYPDAESLKYEQALSILGELMKNEQKFTIFHLIIKSKNNFDNVPVGEIIKMLEGYADPYNANQESLRFLFNLAPYFDRIWIRLFKVHESLNLDQVITVLKAMNTIHIHFNIAFLISEITEDEFIWAIIEKYSTKTKEELMAAKDSEASKFNFPDAQSSDHSKGIEDIQEKKEKKEKKELEVMGETKEMNEKISKIDFAKYKLEIREKIRIKKAGKRIEIKNELGKTLKANKTPSKIQEEDKTKNEPLIPITKPEGLEQFYSKIESRELTQKRSSTIPPFLIELFLSKVLLFSNEANYQKISLALENARQITPFIITPNMKALQIELLNYELYPDRFETTELLPILNNLPEKALDINRPSALRFQKLAENIFPKLDSINKIDVFLNMQRSGLNIPVKFSDYLEELDVPVLESLESSKVVDFYKELALCGRLTANLSKLIVDSFETNMNISTESFEKYADLIYTINNLGYTDFLLNEPNYFLRISHPHSNLNLESMLKFCIVYFPSWTKPDLFVLLYKALVVNLRIPDTKYKNQLNLLEQVQEVLLNDSKERPIFNYQADSYTYLYFVEKKILIDSLQEVIKYNAPNSSVVWQYFADFVLPFPPKNIEFLVNVDENNLFYICKSLWRYRPGFEIHSKLAEKIFLLINSKSRDYTQEIYYLLACGQGDKLQNLKLINKDSLYYLPLCYDLNIKPEISEKLREKVQTNSELFGEPLFKSLILAIKCKLDKNFIKNLSKGLSFYPRDSPKPDYELIKQVVKTVVDYGKNVDLFAFSIFINKHIEIFSDSEIPTLAQFFYPVIDQVFPGLIENFCALGAYPSSNFVNYPEIDYENFDELTEDFNCNVEILKKITQKKLLNKKFFMLFMESLSSSENNLEVLQGIKAVLNYLSLYGNYEHSLEKIFNLIKKFSLLPLLSSEDLLNFVFVYKFTYNLLHTNLQEFTDPLLGYLTNLNFSPNLQISPTGLKFYPSFKYETTYEPRYITSNDKSLLSSEPSLNENQIPENDFLHNLKIFYLLQKFNLPENCDVTQTINSYFMMKSRSKDFIRSSFDIRAHISNYSKTNVAEVDRTNAETPLSCMYEIVLMVQDVGAAMLLDSDMFIFDYEKGDAEIVLPVMVMVQNFEELLGVHIQTYNFRTNYKISEDKDHPFLEDCEKKNIYY